MTDGLPLTVSVAAGLITAELLGAHSASTLQLVELPIKLYGPRCRHDV